MKDGNKISFFAAVLMSINIMVGAGILIAVGPMTEIAGNLSFLGWPLTGLLLFPIILGLSKASHIFSGEGGFYNYCSSGINPLAGVIAHWVYLFGYMGAAASLSTVLRNGLSEISENGFIENNPFVFNFFLVLFYTLINLISVDKISKLQSVGTLLKIIPIVGVIAMMTFYYNPDLEFNPSGLKNMSMTFSTAIFAYMGYEACCSIGGILRDGPQKVGSVVLTAFFVTMSLYTLLHLGLLYIMGGENLATYGAISFPYYLGLSPTVGAAVQIGISFAILFSWANSILSMSLGNITNIYTLAKNHLLLGSQFLSKVNSHQRPVYITLSHGIALFVYITVVKDVEILFSLTNLCVGIATSLTMVAVFLTLLRQKKYQQLIIPFLSFGSCAVWLYYSCLKIPNVLYIIPLVIGLIVGVIMFKIQKNREVALQVPT